MNNKNMNEQTISAFADGELTDVEIDNILRVLRTPDGRQAWDAYHQIGDVLRSDQMAFDMSATFSTKLAKRLKDEPTIIAPLAQTKRAQQTESVERPAVAPIATKKRYLLPSLAAAGVAVVLSMVATPQLMVATKEPNVSNHHSSSASASQVDSTSSKAQEIAKAQSEVLRDPSIDEYLLAHQRFSTSVYSKAQYARSATFPVDSNK